jgi:hypothetical protein
VTSRQAVPPRRGQEFTDNVAAECDRDGYRFEVFAGDGFNPVRPVLQPDGRKKAVDIRTLPFIRFENDEAHCMRFFGLNLGGFNDGGGPPYPGEKTEAKKEPPDPGPASRRPAGPGSRTRTASGRMRSIRSSSELPRLGPVI